MKRTIDIVFSILGLVILSPLLIILAVFVRVLIGHPIFFKQIRPGRYGKSFKMIKFRTMTDARDYSGNLLPDSERLTAFGRFMRSTSLDELPELWNVLKADMSLVGPRPLALEYLALYSPHQARRHEVRPGITGWAQINGRNSISWNKKFDLDIWYVDNNNLWLDIKIILITIKKVLCRNNVMADGQYEVKSFDGTN